MVNKVIQSILHYVIQYNTYYVIKTNFGEKFFFLILYLNYFKT